MSTVRSHSLVMVDGGEVHALCSLQCEPFRFFAFSQLECRCGVRVPCCGVAYVATAVRSCETGWLPFSEARVPCGTLVNKFIINMYAECKWTAAITCTAHACTARCPARGKRRNIMKRTHFMTHKLTQWTNIDVRTHVSSYSNLTSHARLIRFEFIIIPPREYSATVSASDRFHSIRSLSLPFAHTTWAVI